MVSETKISYYLLAVCWLLRSPSIFSPTPLRYFYVDRYVAITPDQAKEIGDNLWLNQENGIYRAGYVSAFIYFPLPVAVLFGPLQTFLLFVYVEAVKKDIKAEKLQRLTFSY